ncbi:hypothetical protein [Arthrobacter pityocampae]|uniref:hypothetical protein n=1 Tax=Arthrobacter pityocampae TaxID=547334 RepID=UPI0037366AE1
MTITRYDFMLYALAFVAWIVIGHTEFWQTLVLATLFVLMFLAGELKEGQRVKRLIKGAAL